MGTAPPNNKYSHPNLVVEYHFNLKTPCHTHIFQKIGASFHEFHHDAQENVLNDLKYLITNSEQNLLNAYHRYKRINNCAKLLISIIIASMVVYAIAYIMSYVPSIEVVWLWTCVFIFVILISFAVYGLFYSSKLRLTSLLSWRYAILNLISRKTLEWHEKSKAFTFSIIYPLTDTQYSGIIRITLGIPRPEYQDYSTAEEPIRNKDQAVSKQKTIQHSNTELEIEKYKPKQFIFKQWKHHQNMIGSDSDSDSDSDHEEKEKEEKGDNSRLYSDYAVNLEISDNSDNSEMEIALEIDDNGYVIERRNSKRTTLPIMINGINGPRRLSQGIKTRMNGEEVILISDAYDTQEQKQLGNISNVTMPMSPVLPDLSFNNDVVFSIHDDQQIL